MFNDLSLGVRTLARSPGFTLSAVLALALGIGANTAVFSVVHAVLINPLPYQQPDRLVRIWETNHAQGIERGAVSAGSFVDWRARNATLADIALYMPRQWLLSFGGELEALRGAMVSPGLFPMLGVAPAIGRTFRPEALQRPPFGDESEVVIGHGLWQRRFGGRDDVLGRTVVLEGRRALTIVGVMPRGFDFPADIEFWTNVPFIRAIGPAERAARFRECIARLRPGVTEAQAQAELTGVAAQIAIEHPQSNAGYGVQVARFDETVVERVKPALLLLLGIVGIVVLIACTNVTNLLLARGLEGRRDVAVRLALGAERWRIVRQGLADGLILATLGALGGVVIGYWGMRALVVLAPADTPRLHDIAFGVPAFLLAATLALAAACVVGIVPALNAAPGGLHGTLRNGRRETGDSRALRAWLIGVEVALTVILLVGASLLLRSFVALKRVDLGFERSHVLTANLILSTARFPDASRPWYRLAEHYDRAVSELAALPGVEAAAAISGLPLSGAGASGKFWHDAYRGQTPDATRQHDAGISIVSPGFFETLRIPLRRGRMFSAADRLSEEALTRPADSRAGRPRGVAIVNEAMARRYWPDGDAIGQSIVLADHWAAASSTIVGVVRDVRAAAVDRAAEPMVYVPFGEMPGFRLSVVLRSTVPVQSLIPAVRDRLRQLDSQMLVANVRTLDDVVSGAVSSPRFYLVLVASFALLALALAAVGIYGVVSYLVTRRTREVGIRMALGASRTHVLSLVLRQGLRPVVAGLLAGSVIATALVRVTRTLLFGIVPLDPWSFLIAAVTLMLAAVGSAVIPAWRAATLDPVVALRDE